MGQRSIMFLAIPGWWNVLAMGDAADKLTALADPADAGHGCSTAWPQAVRIRGAGMDPGNYLVREVALDANRDLVGRTLGDIAAERGTTAAELLIDLSVEEELGTWFMRADGRPHRCRRRRRPARPPARARRRQRRRRPRRLVRHLRRHRLPVVAVRPRDRCPDAWRRRSRRSPPTRRRSGACPSAASCKAGLRRRRRRVRSGDDRPRTGDRVRRLPWLRDPLDPALASASTASSSTAP